MTLVPILNCLACDRGVRKNSRVSDAHALVTAGIRESEEGVGTSASVWANFMGETAGLRMEDRIFRRSP
jgi:hypothetical protein